MNLLILDLSLKIKPRRGKTPRYFISKEESQHFTQTKENSDLDEQILSIFEILDYKSYTLAQELFTEYIELKGYIEEDNNMDSVSNIINKILEDRYNSFTLTYSFEQTCKNRRCTYIDKNLGEYSLIVIDEIVNQYTCVQNKPFIETFFLPKMEETRDEICQCNNDVRKTAKSDHSILYNMTTTKKISQVPNILFFNLAAVYQRYFNFKFNNQGRLNKLSEKDGKKLAKFDLEEIVYIKCCNQPIRYDLKGILCLKDAKHYILMYKDPTYEEEIHNKWIIYDGLPQDNQGSQGIITVIENLNSKDLNLKSMISANQIPVLVFYKDSSI